METVLFNNVKESSFRKFEVLVRCSYVLCQRMGVFGQIYWHMTDWEVFKKLSPVVRKEMFLKNASTDLMATYKEANRKKDIYRKVKHLSPQQLLTVHKLDDILATVEKLFIREMLEKVQYEGLAFYQALANEDPGLLLGFLSGDDEKHDFAKGKTSWLLNLAENSTEYGPDIFWFGQEFFEPELGFDVVWTDRLDQLSVHTDRNSVKMMPLFRIPQMMLLNDTELKYLRKEISLVSDPWHKAFNPILDFWMEKTNEPPPDENFQQVPDLGKEIEKALYASALVTGQTAELAETMAKYEMELCLGYFPTELFWEFYRRQDFLLPQTITILENRSKEGDFRKFTPVFVLRALFPDDKTEEKAETEVKASRKWIDI
jgi:hypothetical protein